MAEGTGGEEDKDEGESEEDEFDEDGEYEECGYCKKGTTCTCISVDLIQASMWAEQMMAQHAGRYGRNMRYGTLILSTIPLHMFACVKKTAATPHR